MSNAVVFAGQGAQSVGMGKGLAEKYDECAALFQKADEALGYSLSSICFDGPEEALTKSNNCQPGIFVTSIACWTALKIEVPGIAVSAAAGLSLGEWSALHAAGALSFEDTLRVLEARGRFMQEACEAEEGGMISLIGLGSDDIARICEECAISVSNVNSGAQTVLAGTKAGVEKAEGMAKEAGAKRAIVLNVAGAFHSRLMQPAADRLKEVLASVEITTPSIPVLSNVTGQPHGDSASIRENMLKQVTETVNWLADVEWMQGNGVDGYIECGPGKVLSGLIKRIHRGAALCNIQDIATLDKASADLKE